MLFNLLEADQSRARHVVVALGNGGPYERRIAALGIQVYCLNAETSRARTLFSALYRFRKIYNSIQPTVIHCWMYHAMLFGAFFKILSAARTKVIWAVHHSLDDLRVEDISTRLALRSTRILQASAWKIVYVSKGSRELHERYGFRHSKGYVIENGINLAKFPLANDVSRKAARRFLGIDEYSTVIMTIGRYHPAKDYPNLLDAFQRMRRRCPRARLVMIGVNLDNENLALARLLEVRHLQDNVTLLGVQNNVARLYPAADCFVLSSKTEGLPVTLIEAMACGRPCVVTDVGECKSVVGEFGVAVVPGNPEALCGALIDVVDRSRREDDMHTAKSIRQYVERNYSIADVVKKYHSLYVFKE